MQTRMGFGWLITALLSALPGSAFAHVDVSGPSYAGQNTLLTFAVGHGCEGADTVGLEITIPEEVSGTRAMPSAFGPVELKADDTGVVTKVVWTKDSARALDELYYEVTIRVKLPDAPFTTVLFPTTQRCRAADGTEHVVEWNATPEEIAAAKDGVEPEPAPAVVVLPVRAPGWNKLTTKVAISDLSIFDDAEIVWVGDAAYSGNPTTAELIEGEDDVKPLTKIAAGAEIWVKY